MSLYGAGGALRKGAGGAVGEGERVRGVRWGRSWLLLRTVVVWLLLLRGGLGAAALQHAHRRVAGACAFNHTGRAATHWLSSDAARRLHPEAHHRSASTLASI